MTSKRPTIAVLIACHNRRAKTLACLDALRAQVTEVALEVIVFDDGSTDGTGEAMRLHYPEVQQLTGSGHAFWAGGMRAAFNHALTRDYDFYLWLNDDVQLLPDAISRLLAAHEELVSQGAGLCLIGGAVIDPDSGRHAYGGIGKRKSWRPLVFERVGAEPTKLRRCDTLNGNVVLIPRNTAKTIGSIDPAFSHTLADLDYGLRVKSAGGWVGLAAGHAGYCAANTVQHRWLNPDLPLRQRWRLVGTPLGLPLKSWAVLMRRHGGPAWFLFVLLIYWRLFVPVPVLHAVKRLRHVAGRAHASAL